MTILLGIDPGLNNTGWGVIQKQVCDHYSFIDCGIFHTTTNQSLDQRLLYLFQSINTIISKYSPNAIAIEKVFVNINPASSEKLIMARTVAFLAIAQTKLQFYEFSPNIIKKNITGTGHSSKEMVNNMVQKILKININTKQMAKTLDAIDALAIALCLAFTIKDI